MQTYTYPAFDDPVRNLEECERGRVWFRIEDSARAQSSGYDDDVWYSIPVIEVYQFPLLKETPKGVQLQLHTYYWLDAEPNKRLYDTRLVCHHWRKKFACPTMEEAWESFLARKRRQAKILKARLETAERFIRYAKQQLPKEPEACQPTVKDRLLNL